jgi:hypothetical protein
MTQGVRNKGDQLLAARVRAEAGSTAEVCVSVLNGGSRAFCARSTLNGVRGRDQSGYHDFRSQGVKTMEVSQQQIRLYVASLP